MRIYKSFFVISFINIYFLGICNTELLSASKKVSKKQSGKNKKKSSNKNKRSLSSSNNTITETDEEENIDSEDDVEVNTNRTISNNLVINTSPDVVAQAEVTPVVPVSDISDEELKNVVNDSSWKDFKYCMQQQCMGGPEQPNNVECYKSVNFDTAFKSCKAMIADTSKQKLYERYFKEIFIIDEQSEACSSMFAGNWNSAKKTCDITVSYVRKYKSKATGMMKNDKVGCDDNAKQIFHLSSTGSSVKFTCSHDVFNLGECYEDNANLQTNQIGLYMGIAQAATGVAVAAASGIAAATQFKRDKSDSDKDKDSSSKETKPKETTPKETTTESTTTAKKDKGDTGAKVAAGFKAGLEAGQGAMLAGASSITQAMVAKKDVGETVNGTCQLPDGTVKSEGSVVEIAW